MLQCISVTSCWKLKRLVLSAIEADENHSAVAAAVGALLVLGSLCLVTVDELHSAEVNVDGLLPRRALVLDRGAVHQPVGRPLEATTRRVGGGGGEAADADATEG